MRLLHVTKLEFQEFFDADAPRYAILSHRWGDSRQEVSYADFLAGRKRDTTGYEKILSFCRTTERHAGLEWCWIDTCCIDKTSSAELSEAINSMFSWYKGAAVCYTYLHDVSHLSDEALATQLRVSDWFYRGWTLQELIAPAVLIFCDQYWKEVGNKGDLADTISEITGISETLLAGTAPLDEFCVAKKMSWAARRLTSRQEDQAYCLLGLFGVNMPLLYGEKGNAFRRLQEVIMSKTDDNSLFAWAQAADSSGTIHMRPSILASSPHDFIGCGEMKKSLASQHLHFELTNRGIMLLIHKSYNPETLETLLEISRAQQRTKESFPLGLILPLQCFRSVPGSRRGAQRYTPMKSFFLKLVLDNGKWRYVGTTSHTGLDALNHIFGKQSFAQDNDYVRLYIHHNDDGAERYSEKSTKWTRSTSERRIHWVYLRYVHSVSNAEVAMNSAGLPPNMNMKNLHPENSDLTTSKNLSCKHCDEQFDDDNKLIRHSVIIHDSLDSEGVPNPTRSLQHLERSLFTRSQNTVLGAHQVVDSDHGDELALASAAAESTWSSIDIHMDTT